jgi:hypothetical protein
MSLPLETRDIYCNKKGCEVNKSYKPLKPIYINNDATALDISYNPCKFIYIKAPVVPSWIIISNMIHTSYVSHGYKCIMYADKTLNAYGSWAGSPFGYGSPPRNSFN